MKFLLASTLIAAFASGAFADVCTGQGEGYCQGVIQCWVEIAGDNIDCEFQIFDSYCNSIGQDDGPNVGDAVDSELPYTVDITQLTRNTNPDLISVQFDYAGGSYGKDISGYSTGTYASGLTGGAYGRSSFPC